jgi:hypothetical protein
MLSPLEKQIRTHALLSSVGFLVLLPAGALLARYLRTFARRWWRAHAAVQLLVAGPVIFAGWYYGHKTAAQLQSGDYNDPHKKIGLALLVLYVAQLALGAFVHAVKLPLRGGHRPPQNYAHAVLGLAILALAAYQVHYGLTIEWLVGTGDLHLIPASARHAWLALIIVRVAAAPDVCTLTCGTRGVLDAVCRRARAAPAPVCPGTRRAGAGQIGRKCGLYWGSCNTDSRHNTSERERFL